MSRGWVIGTDAKRKAVAQDHAHLAINPGLGSVEGRALRGVDQYFLEYGVGTVTFQTLYETKYWKAQGNASGVRDAANEIYDQTLTQGQPIWARNIAGNRTITYVL
jgi:hypothetical protein